ncbi:MAG TPA: hypothetical protein VFN19_05360, partial [Candidatus Nanopelagicales bacterium]|nr:hypothetical protein [Candidatus Nanopelagicales bacterium]
ACARDPPLPASTNDPRPPTGDPVTHFELIQPDDLLVISNTGVQAAQDATCAHGQTAVLLVLFGAYRSHPDDAQRIHSIVPRCILTDMIGSLQAQILHDEGEAAARQFQDEITEAATAAAAALEQLHQQQRDCCEAGFRTNGTEHTCGRNTEEATPRD